MIEASVLVIGAGAIGGVTAAKMTSEVQRVAMLDANEEHPREDARRRTTHIRPGRGTSGADRGLR